MNKWISEWRLFTDELPPEDCPVLLTFQEYEWEDGYRTNRKRLGVTLAARYLGIWGGDWHMSDDLGRLHNPENCIAWMPLPEPYKEGQK